jgi:prophage DNA circulation protein
MGWREDYRQASFRGAPFFVATADSAYGRRVATHEHAQRDVPYNEDMGRKVRAFTVDAYLLGTNYNLARDALIKACETLGPGTLVHPYRGDLTVNCTDLRVSESSSELSFCRLSISFVEAGSNSFPKTKIDSVNAISKKAIGLQDMSLNGFISKYLTDGFPGYVLDSAVKTITRIANFLENPGVTLLGSIPAISRFYAKINALRSGAAVLARRPDQLGASIQNVMRDMRPAFGGNAGPALKNTYKEFTAPFVGPTDTPSRAQEKANYDALQDLTRLTAIGESSIDAAIKASGEPPTNSGTSSSGSSSSSGASGSSGTGSGSSPPAWFETIEDARDTRNELDGAIAIEEEHTDSDPVFTALGALRAEIVKGIPAPDKQLPSLVKYEPTTTQPALKVAQILYNDASRGDEIAVRNKVRHPGFLVGREPIEVLADG